MTSVPMTSSAGSAGVRPAIAPSSGAPASSLDPIKLLNKYKWILLIAGIIGGMLGLGAYFVLLRLAPVWRPVAIFECTPPQGNVGEGSITFMSVEELRQFMQTQARQMSGDNVLSRLSNNPQLRDQAPQWSAQYTDATGGFNSIGAFESLKKRVRSRVIPSTSLIELSFSWKQREDATAILRLLTETYMQTVSENARANSRQEEAALRDAIRRYEADLTTAKNTRSNLIVENAVSGSLATRTDAESAKLAGVNAELLQVRGQVESVKQQLAALVARANSAEGDRFSDSDRADAERDPQVTDSRSRVHALESRKQSLINRGYPPDHREIRQLDAEISAAQQTLDSALEAALDRLARANKDRLELLERELLAQETDLQEQAKQLGSRLTDLNRVQAQIQDLDNRIQGTEAERIATNNRLQELLAKSQLDTAARVVVSQPAQLPNRLAFPQIELMLLAGTVLTVFLVGGTMFVRELVDQRVKGPADVGIIPRTRLLGWVPDAAEDPQGGGAVETAFRDRARGVVAESYRQIRSLIAKRSQQTGHKTIVVLAGMPGSGATSVISNLALAFAAAEQRVLVIDANLRRPAMHRVFGLSEAPGLADVLAKSATLRQTVQSTKTENLDVLTAGGKSDRVIERLATDSMGELLAEARAAYDVVLLDVAPAVVGGDGIALANRCDASILVVRAFGEKRGLVARVKNELVDSRGEFLGVVVNGVRAASGGYLKGNIRTAAEYHRG